MPFDINALAQDPMFMTGMTLLGGASQRNKGFGDVATMLTQMQQQKVENDFKRQQIDIQKSEAERAQMQAKLYEQQVLDQQRRTKMAEGAYKTAFDLLPGILNGQGGGGGVQPASPASPASPATPGGPAPMAPTKSMFSLGDGFVAKEEGGYVPNDGGKGPTNFGINQFANPDVNVKTLTPDAAAQIRKTRYWDAIGADNLPPQTAMVAYDSAINQGVDYARQLIQRTGGDPTLMLYQRRQDYRALAKNPLHANDLKGWESRLDRLSAQLKTADTPAPAAAPTADTGIGGMDPYHRLQAVGGMLQMGSGDMKDIGPGMQAIAGAFKPDTVKPGDVRIGPNGAMTTVPDPLGVGKLQNEQQNTLISQQNMLIANERAKQDAQRVQQEAERIAKEKETEARNANEQRMKLATAKSTDIGEVRSVLDSSNQLVKHAAQLRNDPALASITGAMSIFPNAPGTAASDAQSRLNALGSKVLLNTISSLKSLSANGSTGFGQLSNVEGEHLKNSAGSLNQKQSKESMQKSLTDVMLANHKAVDRSLAVFEKTHNQSIYDGLPIGTRPYFNDKTGEPMLSKSGNQLLKLPDGKLVEVRE